MLSLISLTALVGYLAAQGSATPASLEKKSPLGISLPPLIPAIPGVTEPLASNAPPLPILQVPTPPLDSPPFEVTNLKPKKIGYFWTGAGDNKHKDFLVTVSLDDVSLISPSHHRLIRLTWSGYLWYDHSPHRCSKQWQLASSFGTLQRWKVASWRRSAVPSQDSGHCFLL